jgi:hypothetical protein
MEGENEEMQHLNVAPAPAPALACDTCDDTFTSEDQAIARGTGGQLICTRCMQDQIDREEEDDLHDYVEECAEVDKLRAQESRLSRERQETFHRRVQEDRRTKDAAHRQEARRRRERRSHLGRRRAPATRVRQDEFDIQDAVLWLERAEAGYLRLLEDRAYAEARRQHDAQARRARY